MTIDPFDGFPVPEKPGPLKGPESLPPERPISPEPRDAKALIPGSKTLGGGVKPIPPVEEKVSSIPPTQGILSGKGSDSLLDEKVSLNSPQIDYLLNFSEQKKENESIIQEETLSNHGLTLLEISIFLNGGQLPASKIQGNVFHIPWRQARSRREIATPLSRRSSQNAAKLKQQDRKRTIVGERVGGPVDLTNLVISPLIYLHILKLPNGLFLAYIGKGSGSDIERPGIARLAEELQEFVWDRWTRNELSDLAYGLASPLRRAKFTNWKFKLGILLCRGWFASFTSNISEVYQCQVQLHSRSTTSNQMELDEKNLVYEFLDHKTFAGQPIPFITGPVILVNDQPFRRPSSRLAPIKIENLLTAIYASSTQISALTDRDITNLYLEILPPGWRPWQSP